MYSRDVHGAARGQDLRGLRAHQAVRGDVRPHADRHVLRLVSAAVPASRRERHVAVTLPWARGALFMFVKRDEVGVHLSLECATHRGWKNAKIVTHSEIETWPHGRNDLLEKNSDRMLNEARWSLRSCRCASPLFDEQETP